MVRRETAVSFCRNCISNCNSHCDNFVMITFADSQKMAAHKILEIEEKNKRTDNVKSSIDKT